MNGGGNVMNDTTTDDRVDVDADDAQETASAAPSKPVKPRKPRVRKTMPADPVEAVQADEDGFLLPAPKDAPGTDRGAATAETADTLVAGTVAERDVWWDNELGAARYGTAMTVRSGRLMVTAGRIIRPWHVRKAK